jgi:alpha-ketoglutarate-dependent taurine dioxygenase
MNYRIHENGWTLIFEDFDFKTATQEQVNEITRLISLHTVAVFKNQSLSLADEVRAIKLFNDPERASAANVADSRHLQRIIVPDSENLIARVTGELDEHGEPGLFGHVSDLDWHCNQAANQWRKPLVWLYSIRGSVGSRTSWINYVNAYNDLSDSDKEAFKDIKMINGYRKGSYSPDDFGKEVDINFHYTPSLVYTNQAGVTGLFFPFLQIHEIVGRNQEQSREFIAELRRHVEQEKYMYHHLWDDGDIVISDQWLGVHKRWAFPGIANRLLHRATFHY